MENVGYNPDSIVGTVHLAKYNHTYGTQKGKSIYNPNSSKDFHTYTLECEPTECRIYQDSIQYFTFKNEGKGSEYWPFDKRFHLLLNLAIGGTWGGVKGIIAFGNSLILFHRFF